MISELRNESPLETAVILTSGHLADIEAKTAHGLIRGTRRFKITGVIDANHAGQDAGQVLDGKHRDIPVFSDIDAYMTQTGHKPDYAVIGVALSGGCLDAQWQALTLSLLKKGISIVSGMHMILGDMPEFARAARENNARIIDVRKHKPYDQLHFWSGKIYEMKIPRLAVLGTDCAIGKRTTSRLLAEACQTKDIQAEMIYTGQTGWLQGYPYGFILDTTINDFVSGEIEAAIVACEQEAGPDLIIVEGQSALRNPLGPCGSEFIVSGNIKGVVLQHAPFRQYVDCAEDLHCLLPDIETEIRLVELYGSKVLAVTLNSSGGSDGPLHAYRDELEQKTGIPVILPLESSSLGISRLVPIVREFMAEHDQLPDTTARHIPPEGSHA